MRLAVTTLLAAAALAGCSYFTVTGSGPAFVVPIHDAPPIHSDGGAAP